MKKIVLKSFILIIAVMCALLCGCAGEFTVAFTGNGGTLVSGQEVQTAKDGQGVVAPVYIKDGYTLSWDGTFGKITSNITVTAVWTPVKYTYIFKDWDGTELKTETADYGSPMTPPPAPEKAGHTFRGWKYADESSAEFPFTVTGDVTLYAVWELNSYTVSFDTLGAGEIEPTSANYSTKISQSPDPEKAGHTFRGWQYADGSFAQFPLTVTREVTLYAIWETNSYTVSFDTLGSGEIEPISANYGTESPQPPTRKKPGIRSAAGNTRTEVLPSSRSRLSERLLFMPLGI